MRNNRQHKKHSKHAMELLIRHYRYRRESFSLESEMKGKYREEWHFWTAPCYWYGEQDQQPALDKLFDALLGERTVWTEGGPVYTGEPMPSGRLALIRAVRARHA